MVPLLLFNMHLLPDAHTPILVICMSKLAQFQDRDEPHPSLTALVYGKLHVTVWTEMQRTRGQYKETHQNLAQSSMKITLQAPTTLDYVDLSMDHRLNQFFRSIPCEVQGTAYPLARANTETAAKKTPTQRNFCHMIRAWYTKALCDQKMPSQSFALTLCKLRCIATTCMTLIKWWSTSNEN